MTKAEIAQSIASKLTGMRNCPHEQSPPHTCPFQDLYLAESANCTCCRECTKAADWGRCSSPKDFNLPAKFETWRKTQIEGVQAVLDSKHPITVLSQSTGSGKSAIPPMIGELSDQRVVVLTATKGLQDQYGKDFGPCGMADMRGVANYKCHSGDERNKKGWWTCDRGIDEDCNLYGTPLCQYSEALTAFRASPLGVTNYQFWMHSRRASKGSLGNVGILVCDEAHAIFDQISDFVAIHISYVEAPLPMPIDRKGGLELDGWKRWAVLSRKALKRAHGQEEDTDTDKDLDNRLWWISTLTQGEWVWEADEKGITFECIWPGKYVRSNLFSGVPRIVMLSGTVRPYTLQLLGVPKSEYEFKEWPRVFPLNRMPFIHIPTVKMTWRTDEDELKVMVARVDQIIEDRLDRKGIIQTKSYERAAFIQRHSQYARLMILNNDARETSAKAEEFRRSAPPRVLVSPSFSTGWDFPYCVSPNTKVLTADLQWKQIGDLHIGQKLAAFDEERVDGRRSRRWQEATITGNALIRLPCYQIGLEDGTRLISSHAHKWLVFRNGVSEWVETQNLRGDATLPSSLCQIADVWKTDADYASGYLASAFDGEGYLSQRVNKWNRGGDSPNIFLGLSQTENEMLYKIMELLKEKGFPFSGYFKKRTQDQRKDGISLLITRRSDIMRFLGQIRPERLLPKLRIGSFGSLRSRPVKVVSKEFIGEQDVMATGTTTKTLVAEGFASHNSECEYQIIAKVPFDVTTSHLAKERNKDKKFMLYSVMQELQQMRGRGMRAADDRCEVYCIDDQIEWVVPSGIRKGMAPSWFNMRTCLDPPPPPPKLHV